MNIINISCRCKNSKHYHQCGKKNSTHFDFVSSTSLASISNSAEPGDHQGFHGLLSCENLQGHRYNVIWKFNLSPHFYLMNRSIKLKQNAFKPPVTQAVVHSSGSVVVDSLLIVAFTERFWVCSMFCCALLCAISSCAIVLMGKRELVALLCLSS